MKRLASLLTSPVMLPVILMAAFILRATGVNWDDYSHLHPDERFLTTVVSRIGSADNFIDDARAVCVDAERTSQYFDTECSPLNPDNVIAGSYAYGTLPLFMVRAAGELTSVLNPANFEDPRTWVGYDYVHLVGRFVNAIADTLATLFVYLIAARLFTRNHGLLAAAFYAFAVMPIQQAHFWTVDTIANLFLAIGIYAAVEVGKSGRVWGYVLFGAAFGAALASRINLLPMFGLLPLAVLLRFRWRGIRTDPRRFAGEALLTLGALCLGAFVFRIGQPYAFIGPTFNDWTLDANWLSEINYVSNLSRTGTLGWPPSIQWFGRSSFAFAWWNMMAFGLGLPLGITATIAIGVAVLYFFVRRRQGFAIGLLLVWIAVYFAATGGLHQMTMRYYLPLYAVLCVLAAWLLILWRWPRRVLLPLVLGLTIVWALSFVNIYSHELTRLEASRWTADQYDATITLRTAAEGVSIPLNIPREIFRQTLYTSTDGESFLGEAFEITEDQQVSALVVAVAEGDNANATIQIFREDAVDQAAIYGAQMIIENGHGELRDEAMRSLPPGAYRWHLMLDWELTAEESAITERFRHFIAMAVRPSGERIPVQFRTPYSSLRFAMLEPEREWSVGVSDEAPETIVDVVLPHAFGAPSDLRFRVGDLTVTAALVGDGVLRSSPVGSARRYVFETPIEISRSTPMTLLPPQTEDEIFYFTGTIFANEGSWDDGLPTRFCDYAPAANPLDTLLRTRRDCREVNAGAYGWIVDAPIDQVEGDTDVKRNRMIDTLYKSDVFMISSNRFYDSQARLPRLFAMSIEYYRRLFAGELGYELVNTFTRPPSFFNLFPISHEVLPTANVPERWNEFEAEEAFTVYDHPTVFVFENVGFEPLNFPPLSLTTEAYERAIAAGDTSTASAARVTVDLDTLPDATFQLQPAPQTDSDPTLIIWLIGFVLLGWLSFPLMYVAFPHLPLRGFGFGRAAGWLALALVMWWLSTVVSGQFWMQPALWVGVIVYAALNLWIGYRRRGEITRYLRDNWYGFVATEGVFILAILFGIVLRASNPDLWHPARGGEKPMDFTYLNAVLRAPQFPPPNPWLAGYAINYYYFGFVIAALPIKLANIASEVGYNLVLVTLYGVVSTGVFTLAYSFLPRINKGARMALAFVGTLFAMAAGNLGTLRLIVDPEPGIDATSNRWYWYPTRILGESANRAGGAINEMPIFSFLFGDLHAHIIGLLPATLYLAILWSMVKERKLWYGLPLGIIAGVIYMTNTWDVLLYVPLGTLAMLIATYRGRRFPWFALQRFIPLAILVVIGGVITIYPYARSSTIGEANGIGLWDGERSLIGPFLLVWGIPLAIMALWLVHRLKRVVLPDGGRPIEIAMLLVAALLVAIFIPTIATSVLLILVLGAAAALAVFDAREVRAAHLGVGLFALILLGLEYVVVRGDVGRMNTVFKISFQLWVWVGLLIPVLLYWLLQRRARFQAAIGLALIAAGLLFAVYALPARYSENATGGFSLDGDRFFQSLEIGANGIQVPVTQDASLIQYLRANEPGFPVIIEWYSTEYQWHNRIAVHTGLPAVTGWANHLRQQYASLVPMIEQRIADVQRFYTTDRVDEMRVLIAKYDIRYIVFGQLERSFVSPGVLFGLETLVEDGTLTIVFEDGETRLYRVSDAALDDLTDPLNELTFSIGD